MRRVGEGAGRAGAAGALALALGGGAVGATPAAAEPAQQVPGGLLPGTVIGLQNTNHLWVAGPDGLLHYAGDTRALMGRQVAWDTRFTMSLDDLREQPRGMPWLSAGLLKIGDPLYLVKWETGEPEPRLLHIESIQDAQLIGVRDMNYGDLVFGREEWQSEFNMNVDALERGDTFSIVSDVQPAPPPPEPMDAQFTERRRVDEGEFEYEFVVTNAEPNSDLFVRIDFEEWLCNPECNDTFRLSRGPFGIGRTDENGTLVFRDSHPPYNGSTYTITGPDGVEDRVSVGNDLR